ncbi:MAG TPA: serine/threonine-protein kinase [Gemmatimonadales bacterium]|jgi:serine/threonine-protein kinase|nr:serine/threonine-protein kinase [Gemmatimonadales bacterium]
MAQENLAGRSIAGYRLLERVGEGGTATVYRAEHDVHGRCAVKTLRERLRDDPTAVKRFLREAGYGSRVRHPNVVRTYDYGDTEGLYYLALEWAAGEPLAEAVARHRRLPAPEVAHIVEQLAGALDAAHAVGIIHRDLKPENIVYDASSGTAKLLDFGIARDAEEDPAERLTRTGFFVGTLQYVAPEALSGELVGEAADIYSLATITYHLLTGVHPYTGRSPRELFQKLLTEPPTPLNEAVKELQFARELENAVMKGLARDAADRQASVLAFADDVRRGAASESAAPLKRGIFSLLGSLMGRKS